MARVAEPVAWMSLVDVSGPFLAGTVLEEVFPQGLDKVETPRRQRLRSAYEEWQDAVDESDAELEKLHDAWVRMVVTEALEYDADVLAWNDDVPANVSYRSPEHGKELRPDLIVRNGDAVSKLLISFYPPGTNLEGAIAEQEWPISPAERMTLLCRASNCRIGLITNGEQWMLVNAPVGETSGYVSWYARLWWQEPVTLKAFQSLLGVRRCFGPEQETLPRLLERSLDFQEEVTTTLGEQVRRAVEVLIQSLGRADQDRNGELLKDVEPDQLYEAGLTVMMRLVFILCAEERGLLLLGDQIYDQHYAISTLRSKLREDSDQHSDEVLEKRQDAWSRLLSVFRLIYGGAEHESLRLPALGGSLFDPDKYPFLEGRSKNTTWRDTPALPLPIDNRTVLLLMTALQVLEQRGGARLLSYRALDVEQIGHVYEGLLEFTAARVPEITLGLIGTKKLPNPQVTFTELESAASDGASTLNRLKELTGRSIAALRKSLDTNTDRAALARLTVACHGRESLAKRLLPFVELIRPDSWGNLLVYPEGSFAIAKGTDRRSSGTHYTPRSLTEPIARYTLEPLVYVGPVEGHPQEEWKLKASAEILALKVCDMACGSGAFLVEACRYLSQRLIEAWTDEEAAGLAVDVDGVARDSLEGREGLPKNLDDRLLIARRLVAQSCLYGVDVNHLAVELAKLSIWLVTLAKNKPFSFLDHALRCGDSLVGLHDLEQLRFYSLKPDADHPVLFKGPLNTVVDEAVELRLQLEEMPTNTVADIELQGRLLSEAEEKLARLRCAADLLVAAQVWGESITDKQERTRDGAMKSAYYLDKGTTEEFQQVAAKERRGQKMFHWPLEFPEVVVKRGGFDAIVGNPPFLGCKYFKPTFGPAYFPYLSSSHRKTPGRTDLCGFFFNRADSLLGSKGCAGLIATNTISQGDTQQFSLSPLIHPDPRVFRASIEVRWPGTAAVYVTLVHWTRYPTGNWRRFIDGGEVEAISEYLTAQQIDKPRTLKANLGICFQGSIPNAPGLFLTIQEAAEFIKRSPKEKKVVRPFLDDINSNPEMQAKRWCIFFGNMSQSEAAQYQLSFKRCEDLVRPVKQKKGGASAKYWWRFYRYSPELQDQLERYEYVFVTSLLTKYLCFSQVPSDFVFTNKLAVVATDDWRPIAVLQSSIHEAWARQFSTTMKIDLTYTPTDCFETFPFPISFLDSLSDAGQLWHRLLREEMKERNEGLTDYLNRFHDEQQRSDRLVELRRSLKGLDQAVASAYGWSDLDLNHDFRETKQGRRFTISEPARSEILNRLLKLNRERYEEEVRNGLHEKKAGKRNSHRHRTPTNSNQLSLIDCSKEVAVEMIAGDTWYFAYGSNMSGGRKEERTGLIRSARKAKLGGYRLAFNKDGGAQNVYASIAPMENADVWGVVYLCDEEAMSELDRREGVMGGHYERATVTVELESGELIDAVTYVAGQRFVVEEAAPTAEYLGFILEGAEQHSLPPTYINAVRKLATRSETA